LKTIRFVRGHRALDSADHWRMRAEGIRTLAEGKSNASVRVMMRRIAADYDRQADWLEKQESSGSNRTRRSPFARRGASRSNPTQPRGRFEAGVERALLFTGAGRLFEKLSGLATRTSASLHRDQAENRLAQALAGLSQRLQLVEPATLNPDEIAVLSGPLRLVVDRAERERRGDGVEGGGRDGDADQPRELALGLVLSTLGQRDTH
jgi:hypothetical protein